MLSGEQHDRGQVLSDNTQPTSDAKRIKEGGEKEE